TIEHSLDNIQEASKSANQVPYKASEAEKPLNIINVFDLQLVAKKVIPEVGYGYISSGAGDLWTIQQNIESFNHKLIVPRVLKNIENPDQRTSIFGTDLATPIIMAPVASHGLANAAAEPATAKAVAESG